MGLLSVFINSFIIRPGNCLEIWKPKDLVGQSTSEVTALTEWVAFLFTCGMKVPNVVVVSRMGERLGICWCGPRKVSGMSCRWEWGLEDETYHVISDVHAEGSSFVVHKSCRVGGESRQGHVQHVVVLGRQRKGWSRERRLLMLPDVVKLALNKEKKIPQWHFSTMFLLVLKT